MCSLTFLTSYFNILFYTLSFIIIFWIISSFIFIFWITHFLFLCLLGTRNGQSFINDPSMTDATEVKANIKLRFTNRKGIIYYAYTVYKNICLCYWKWAKWAMYVRIYLSMCASCIYACVYYCRLSHCSCSILPAGQKEN